MAEKLKFYGDSISGNCYKLQHAAAELQLDYDWHEMNILDGDTREPWFRALNANGKVPLMQLPDGRTLAESNAILHWLAHDSALLGDDRYAKAKVQEWLFFEQYSHEPYIATSRFIVKYLGSPPDRQEFLESRRPSGYKALKIMNDALGEQDFLANNQFSIADIALFAYTHVADEGDFDLGEYPAINAWMARIRARENFVAMKAAP